VKEETADSDTIVSIPTIEVKVKVPDVAPTDATEESEDDVLNKYLRMTSQVGRHSLQINCIQLYT